MDHFKDLSDEVIFIIGSQLDIKSLCRMIISCKDFKSFCDTNDMWKKHYCKTLEHKFKIIDTSVHIGGMIQRDWIYDLHYGRSYINNPMIYQYEFKDGDVKLIVNSTNSPNQKRIQNMECLQMWDYRENVNFIKTIGRDPGIKFPKYMYGLGDGYNQPFRTGCLGCQNKMMRENGFYETYVEISNMNVDYNFKKGLLFKKWKEFNDKFGLTKLCQDISHYDQGTLEMPKDFKNYKDYKHVIIKKLYTKHKKTGGVKRSEFRIGQSEAWIHDYKKKILELEKSIKDNKESIDKYNLKTERFEKSLNISI